MTTILEGQKSAAEMLKEAKRLKVPASRIDPGGTPVPGTRLLQEVSEALGGVWVQASDTKQRYFIPGMNGTVYRCNPRKVINLGSGWWSVPDATQWPEPPVRPPKVRHSRHNW